MVRWKYRGNNAESMFETIIIRNAVYRTNFLNER